MSFYLAASKIGKEQTNFQHSWATLLVSAKNLCIN